MLTASRVLVVVVLTIMGGFLIPSMMLGLFGAFHPTFSMKILGLSLAIGGIAAVLLQTAWMVNRGLRWANLLAALLGTLIGCLGVIAILDARRGFEPSGEEGWAALIGLGMVCAGVCCLLGSLYQYQFMRAKGCSDSAQDVSLKAR